jgi:hypothetical protein
MRASVMFLDCPAWTDEDGAVRCGLPAAVEYWYVGPTSSGPLECAKIRCPRGHFFNGPVEFLTVTSAGQAARGTPARPPGDDTAPFRTQAGPR